jgi:FMN phosphatase YigB (HAD superfamily)
VADRFMSLFDHVIESGKTGLRKSDLRIYQMMVESLDVDSQAIDELETATRLLLR